MAQDTTLIVIASAVGVCGLCQWLAWRAKLPAIIFLLSTGILAGPILNILDPDRMMGHLFHPFISLSVALILFEGSLTLKFKEIFELQKVLRNMLSIGLLITWGTTTLAARFAVGVSWEIAALFGAITVVTGPTVIAPLLRSVRPSAPVANILRWEGIVIDPVGASFSVLVYEFIVSGGGQTGLQNTLIVFAKIIIIGVAIGAAAGYLFGLALKFNKVPDFLQNVASLGLVFTSFVAANTLQPESGLVTVTVLGIWLANMPGVDLDAILKFKEHLSVLLISLLFIMLASRLDIASFQELGWAALFVFATVQLVARPLNVLVSSIGSQLSLHERYLLSWIAPRGIVAAAISSLFAIRLEQTGFTDAHLLAPLTFTVIIGTVFLQSLTARPLAKFLKVAEPEPRGFLIIGANIVAREVAHALHKAGIRVVLADDIREDIQTAETEGLETYLGNPVSEHADRRINMTGIGGLLALSPYESVNYAAVAHYSTELGPNNAYVLQSRSSSPRSLPAKKRARTLFGGNITYVHLAYPLLQGGHINSYTCTNDNTEEILVRIEQGRFMPLFVIDTKNKVHAVDVKEKIQPEPGWTILALAAGSTPEENSTEEGDAA